MNNRYDEAMSRIHSRYVPGAVPITEAAVVKFENELTHSLPVDYRHFLLKYGFSAGKAYTHYGELEFPHIPIRDNHVGIFYGLQSTTSRNLDEIWRLYYGTPMPDRLLPIASSDAGQICLSLFGLDADHIYLWHLHELEIQEPALIAYSFDSFIRSLISLQ